jgi:hypothetical protein
MVFGIDFSPLAKVGLIVTLAGMFLWLISLYFYRQMQTDLNPLAPSSAKGPGISFETFDRRRVWFEHQQLFPESKTRSKAKIFRMPAVITELVGFVLFCIGICTN